MNYSIRNIFELSAILSCTLSCNFQRKLNSFDIIVGVWLFEILKYGIHISSLISILVLGITVYNGFVGVFQVVWFGGANLLMNVLTYHTYFDEKSTKEEIDDLSKYKYRFKKA